MQILPDIVIHTESSLELIWSCVEVRLNAPANAAMDYYLDETGSICYSGRPRTTIVTTLQDDIKRTLENIWSFSVKNLKNNC